MKIPLGLLNKAQKNLRPKKTIKRKFNVNTAAGGGISVIGIILLIWIIARVVAFMNYNMNDEDSSILNESNSIDIEKLEMLLKERANEINSELKNKLKDDPNTDIRETLEILVEEKFKENTSKNNN